jgi:hypothetical protein
VAAYKGFPISANTGAGGVGPLAAGAVLHTVVVGAPGASWTVTLYDGPTTGVPFATITPAAGATYIFDVTLANGLTVVTAGTTPGNITINGG